jgi:bacteriorhodopsin
MKDRRHVLELVFAIVLTAIVIAWLIAYATVWIMQGQ